MKKIYEDKLREIKLLDPACGSGAFLNQAFDYLLNEHKWINDQRDLVAGVKSIFAVDSAQRNILKNNLFGVDLNEESVEITKLSLWLKTANKRKPLTNLDDNIKCGNSLIDDFEVAGGKAFVWENEFVKIMEAGGFDVVIGNPPYVRVHNLNDITKEFLWINSTTFKAKGDLYAAFVEKGINLTKADGLFSFIVPHTWMGLESFNDLREYILKQSKIKSLTVLPKKVFKDAQVETIIFLFKKSTCLNNNKMNVINIFHLDSNSNLELLGKKKQREYYPNSVFNIATGKDNKLLKKIENGKKELSSYVEFFYGLKTADDAKFLTKSPKFNREYKKLLRRRNFNRYIVNFDGEYVWYRPKLMIKNKKTARPGNPERFEKPKIIIMDIAKKIVAAYDDKKYYVKDALILQEKGNICLKYLLAIINSKLISYYYQKSYSVLSVAKNAFLSIPVKIPDKYYKNKIIHLVGKILKDKKRLRIISDKNFVCYNSKFTSSNKVSLNKLVNDGFYNLIYSGRARKLRNMTVDINSEIITIYTDKSSSDKYEILKFEEENEYKRRYIKYYLENLTDEHLENLNELEGNILERTLQIGIPDYGKDHVVKKVVNEWEKLQSDIRQLEKGIERTDKEIDQLVYELYGLTDKEIEIVEDSV